MLSDEELRRLLAACAGRDFTARRDNAIIMLFLDGGLRLSELADLQVADVDLPDRIVYDWAFLRLDDGDPAPGGQAGQRWLLVRRNRKTGELAFYYCWTPRLVSLATLVRVAGRRWAIEERFQTGKGLVGLDQHQVRRWRSWYRWTTLAMLAHALLVVLAATHRTRHPPSPGLISLTCNEVQHLLATLLARPAEDLSNRLAWSVWRRRHQARARTCHYQRQANQP